jgi:hypothetical protein
MTDPTLSPSELRGQLRKGDSAARREFRGWAASVVQAVVGEAEKADPEWRRIQPDRRDAQRRVYTNKLLTLAELAFAFSPALAPRKDDNWDVLQSALACRLLRALSPPPSTTSAPVPAPAIEGCRWFDLQTWSHPYQAAPEIAALFSGDWLGHWRTPAGELWVLIADVTHHGFAASLIARALPDLWAYYWEVTPAGEAEPLRALVWMDEKLTGCLPEDVFVEAALVRLTPSGDVVLAAMRNRAVLRRARQKSRDWEVTRSDGRAFLLGYGMFAMVGADVHPTRLSKGDEVLLGTDGLYDVLGEARVAELLKQAVSRPLQDVVRDMIPVAVASPKERDDLTAIVARFRGN